jgi:hypothetical protein
VRVFLIAIIFGFSALMTSLSIFQVRYGWANTALDGCLRVVIVSPTGTNPDISADFVGGSTG